VPDGVQEAGMRRAGVGEVGVWEFKVSLLFFFSFGGVGYCWL
jgi:hypothetical protein